MERQHLSKTQNAIASSNRESAITRNYPHPIEELQGAIGNRAVNQLLANQPIVQAKSMFRGLSPEFCSDLTQINQPIQAKEADSASVPKAHTENKTGLPDNLKVEIENLSGIAMDDVRVHYNSSKPSELQALAYTQGTDIHIAPGQEEHLPHEAWHFVQQMQGRVKPTIQTTGVGINDDPGLEKEADVMGSKALQMKSDESTFEFLDNSPEAVAQTKIPDIQAGRVAALQGKDIPINADPKLEPETDVLGAKAAQGESVRVAVANRTVRGGTGNDPVQCVSSGPDKQKSAQLLVDVYEGLHESPIFQEMDEEVTKQQKITLIDSSEIEGKPIDYERLSHTIRVPLYDKFKNLKDASLVRAELLWEMQLAMNREHMKSIYENYNNAINAGTNQENYDEAAKALSIEWLEWSLVPAYLIRKERINEEFPNAIVKNFEHKYSADETGWYLFKEYMEDNADKHTTGYDKSTISLGWVGHYLVYIAREKYPETMKITLKEIENFKNRNTKYVKNPLDNPFQQANIVADARKLAQSKVGD